MLLRNAINNIYIMLTGLFFLFQFSFLRKLQHINMNKTYMNYFLILFVYVLTELKGCQEYCMHLFKWKRIPCKLCWGLCAIFQNNQIKTGCTAHIYVTCSFNKQESSWLQMAGSWTVCRFCVTEIVCATKLVLNIDKPSHSELLSVKT